MSLKEHFEDIVSDVKSMDTSNSDFGNLFSVGCTMGRYWLICDILGIDGEEYAEAEGLDLVDF